MILIDSSTWIEYDRGTGSLEHRRLAFLIETDEVIGVSEPIVMEVAAGARSDIGETRLRRLLSSHHWIPLEPSTDFDAAVSIYRLCRGSGITPRGLVDCLIAAIALRSGSSLLAADRDFARIASVVPLQLDAYS